MSSHRKFSAEEATDLWTRFQHGDVQAWSALLEGYYRTLFNYGRRLETDRDLLHDCIQELFLNLWDSRANLNPSPVSVSFYLLRAFRNLLLKEVQKRTRQHPNDESLSEVADSITIEDWLIDREEVQLTHSRIKNLLCTLSPREQEIVFLKFYENLSNQQIADLLNIRKQSVANLLYSGLQHLRLTWKDKFGSSSLLWLLFYWASDLTGWE